MLPSPRKGRFLYLVIAVIAIFHLLSIVYFQSMKTYIDRNRPKLMPLDPDHNLYMWPEVDCRSDAFFEATKNNSCEKMNLIKPDEIQLANNVNPTKFIDYSRVVLAITFNKPLFDSIPKVYRLYHRIFNKIIFCVPQIRLLQTFHQGIFSELTNVSIAEYTKQLKERPGANFHNCILVLLDIFPSITSELQQANLDGILHISDDMVPNLWAIEKNIYKVTSNWIMVSPFVYDLDRKMTCHGKTGDNVKDCTDPKTWDMFEKYHRNLVAVFTETEQLYPEFTRNLSIALSGKRRVCRTGADIFYIARDYLLNPTFIAMLRLFVKHDVYVELAMPMLLYAASPTLERLILLPMEGGNRGRYNVTNPMHHSFKMARVHQGSPQDQCSYCFLSNLFDKTRERLM